MKKIGLAIISSLLLVMYTYAQDQNKNVSTEKERTNYKENQGLLKNSDAGGGKGGGSILDRRLEVIRESGDFGPGKSSVYGLRSGVSGTPESGGTGWASGSIDGAVIGYNDYGNWYTAGVAGYNYHDYGNTAGVVGARYNGLYAGYLSYREEGSSGKYWSGYFTDDVRIDEQLKLTDLAGSGTRNLVVDADGYVGIETSAEQEIVLGMGEFLAVDLHDHPFEIGTGGAHYLSGNGTLAIPITFPAGTNIKKIEVLYRDVSSTDLNIKIRSHAYNDFGGTLVFADFSSSGSSSPFQNYTYSTPFTMTNERTYIVEVTAINGEWNSLTRIKSVRLTYE